MTRLGSPKHWGRATGWIETVIAVVVLITTIWLYASNVNKPKPPEDARDKR